MRYAIIAGIVAAAVYVTLGWWLSRLWPQDIIDRWYKGEQYGG